MRRNVHNWFLCGLSLGAVLGLGVLMVALARAAVVAGDFAVYPFFATAVVVGAVAWLFKRDPRGVRGARAPAGYCFISKERKARIEDLP